MIHTDSKRALILFSHGSLLCGAGQTLQMHAQRLRDSGEFSLVEIGYLNYSEPRFEEAVERCAAAGITDVVVVPYFLVAGKFVLEDLPPKIDLARATYPHMHIDLGRPVGFDVSLADAITELAANARTPQHWRDDLGNAPWFCEARADCPLYGTEVCPVSRHAESSKIRA